MSTTLLVAAAYEDNDAHLRDELARVAGFARAQLLRFELARPEASRERFWNLADAELEALAADDAHTPMALFDPPLPVRRLLEQAADRRRAIDQRIEAGRPRHANHALALWQLAREFALDAVDVDALLLALLPTLHSSYRRWYGVLQQDANRTHASVGLLVEMLAASADDIADRLAALGPTGRLARSRLVTLTGSDDDPPSTRGVHVDERVSRHLFHDDAPDARLADIVHVTTGSPPPSTSSSSPASPSSTVLPIAPRTRLRLLALPNLRAADIAAWMRLRLRFSGPDPALAVRAATLVTTGAYRRLLTIDVPAALAGPLAWPLAIDLALREARLLGAMPMFVGAGSLHGPEERHRLDTLMARIAAFAGPLAIEAGEASIDSGGGEWLAFHLDAPDMAMREHLWLDHLAASPEPVTDAAGLARSLANAFRFTGRQIDAAWQEARGAARLREVYDAPVSPDDLFRGCRQQTAGRLGAYAQRIEPIAGLSLERDIVLPVASLRQLTALRARIRNHRRVQDAMSLGVHMRLARGVTAMFVGGSGTGKTLAAEVLASEERVDLYRIDLGALVSKWVGETEKNISRVFAEAESANCMLFFDEADALFGRRGEVKGGQDHYMNLQVNHLLQGIESYSGVAILATNLRQQIDDAFQRRIHLVVEFPAPDAAARRALWHRLLPTGRRRGLVDAEIEEIAQRFELSGGNIRNVVLDACYRALERGGGTVEPHDVVAAIAREFQKAGRPVMAGEFGRYFGAATRDDVDAAAREGIDATAGEGHDATTNVAAT